MAIDAHNDLVTDICIVAKLSLCISERAVGGGSDARCLDTPTALLGESEWFGTCSFSMGE
jgi:hypothetical protein